uniref:ATPase H+ transporting V1 subunit G1 n=1 Tax=Crocodylus porosus TaxID=8502 RepID=A0A7M4F0M9_CROPO
MSLFVQRVTSLYKADRHLSRGRGRKQSHLGRPAPCSDWRSPPPAGPFRVLSRSRDASRSHVTRPGARCRVWEPGSLPWPASRKASSSCCRLRSAPPRRWPRPASALGCHGSCTTEVEKETQEKMSIIQENFQKNREEVLTELLSLVCDIKPKIHMNYRISG